MSDSETQRQESSEQYDYREATRFLSEFLLRRYYSQVQEDVGHVIGQLHADEFVQQEEIDRAAQSLAAALDAVEVVAAAQEGTTPTGLAGNPKFWRPDEGGVTTE